MGIVYDKLYKKYNKSILIKAEVAEEMGVSQRSINRRLKEGKMVKPIESGERRLEWSLKDIATYLGDKHDKNDN